MKFRKLLLILASVVSFSAFAADEILVDENSVALSGYDPVAYFVMSKPVEGKSTITAVNDNVIYYFSSEENRDLFNSNPEKYTPQYGGFCAYGAALGKKFTIDVNAFEVVDGKLYLNKSPEVYETWVEDKEENIVEADKKWPEIKSIAVKKL